MVKKLNNEDTDLKKNGSGYYDPTAYIAIKHADSDNIKNRDRNFCQLLDSIFAACDAADFHVEGRIILKDKITGKIYR